MTYNIIREKIKDGWQVLWDDRVVYKSHGRDAEWTSGAFANGLEMGITGSKEPLHARSKITIKGWYGYLDAFDSYEDYRC